MSPMLTLGAAEIRTAPGTWVSMSIPAERLYQMISEAEARVSEAHRAALFGAGFNGTRPIPPPSGWTLNEKGHAAYWMELVSELSARRGYSPWTADIINESAPGWTYPGSVEIGPKKRRPVAPDYRGDGSWAWKGVRSIKSNAPDRRNARIITCGMLKDRGVISTAQECEAEKEAVRAAYDMQIGYMMHRVRKRQRRQMRMIVAVSIPIMAASIVASIFLGPEIAVAAGVAVSSAMSAAGAGATVAVAAGALVVAATGSAVATGIGTVASLATGVAAAEITDQNFKYRKFFDELAKSLPKEMLTGTVTGAGGPIGQIAMVTKNAVEIAEELDDIEEKRKEAKKTKRAEREKIDEALAELAALMEERAELEKLNEQLAVLETQIAEGEKVIASERRKKMIVIGAIAVGAALLLKR